jgi:stage II sporulation protein E
LNKAFDDKFIIQNQECGLRENKTKCKFTYMLQDKYNIQIGVAKTTKADSPISGDSNLQTKLEDGKYLLALSDGMGSGPEARKSSKIAIKMLERLLEAGFDKDISIKLINSTLIANLEEDMYATLDVAILDLYKGNLEFIKNGACPTFIKRGKEIQILKSLELPTGIVENMDLVVYDYDLQPDDLIVMCTDGVIESNTEYISKELWIKYLLEDMQTTDAQKIADIILSEAIDNNYGKQKDDMTVIVAKIGRF